MPDRRPLLIALLLIPAFAHPAAAQTESPTESQMEPLGQRVEIALEHDSDGERATREQLREVLARYDVERWTVTERLRIAEDEIPHSHPVLTLHTRALGAPVQQLSTYLHEQFHWWVSEHPAQEEAAVAAFRGRFPDVPAGGGQGGRDEYSTYLHLIVCDLEYQAMTELVGEAEARDMLAGWNHYTWIYDKVLNDAGVREINRANGFDVGEIDTRPLRR